jgi:hypothetical protein
VQYDTDVVVGAFDTDGGIALDFKGGHDRETLRDQVEALGDAYEARSEGLPVRGSSSTGQHVAATTQPSAGHAADPTAASESPAVDTAPQPAALVPTQVNYQPTPGGARLEFVAEDLRDVEYLRAVIRQDALAMSRQDRCLRFD